MDFECEFFRDSRYFALNALMFSSTNCVYCDVAKETFASMGTQFKSLEVRKKILVILIMTSWIERTKH